VIGYFGKIPSHGDFVSRGLPADLVAAWDKWLQACIHASQRQLGDQWLTHYLTSPVWRFAISPGILGTEGLGGVMMPSVDRVGRYFPLMVAATGSPPLLDWFHKQASWYDEIEALARASLENGFRLDRFDAAAEPGVMPIAPDSAAGSVWRISIGKEIDERVAALALQGHSLWWSEASADADARFLMCAGMPQQQAFAEMLD
jgi:type VI secretion system protein ImpM